MREPVVSARLKTLADRLAEEGPLHELDAVGWIIRLARHVEVLHANERAHGKISPACFSTEARDRSARGLVLDAATVSEAIAYHSPERIAGGGASKADDIWALSATLYAALTGSPPFGLNGELLGKGPPMPPPPLAVYDVGDDDLQRLLDAVFVHEASGRPMRMTDLREQLVAWHPDVMAKELPRLELTYEEEDDDGDATRVRPAPASIPSTKAQSALGNKALGDKAKEAPARSEPPKPLPAAGRPAWMDVARPPIGDVSEMPSFQDDDDDDDDLRTVMRPIPEHVKQQAKALMDPYFADDDEMARTVVRRAPSELTDYFASEARPSPDAPGQPASGAMPQPMPAPAPLVQPAWQPQQVESREADFRQQQVRPLEPVRSAMASGGTMVRSNASAETALAIIVALIVLIVSAVGTFMILRGRMPAP